MALSIPFGMGAEVSVSDIERSDWTGGSKMLDDVQSAIGLRGGGIECAD